MGVRASVRPYFSCILLTSSRSLRHYVGIFREDTLLGRLKTHLSPVKTHNFEIISLEPHQKDGGVFVHFKYSAGDQEEALKSIEADLRIESYKHGGLPSWLGLSGGTVWLVKGRPWREVRILQVEFLWHISLLKLYRTCIGMLPR